MTDLPLGNGLLRVERVHTSKRGRTYKRRRIVLLERKDSWFKRAMLRRWGLG